jgi:hypothetical protein
VIEYCERGIDTACRNFDKLLSPFCAAAEVDDLLLIFITLLSINLKVLGFSPGRRELFILSHGTLNELCKIIYFFNLVIKLFFGDLVLVEDQCILISNEIVGLKEEGLK